VRDRSPALETTTLVTAIAAAMSVVTALALVKVGPVPATLLALSPVLAMAVVYLVTSGQSLLYVAAFVVPMTSLPIFGEPLIGPVVFQDLIAVLAFGALIYAVFLGRGRVPPVPGTPVLGWPYVLFAVIIFAATLRGHYAFGASVVGQPLRLFLFAAIVAGLIGMTVPRMHRLLIAVFYPGALFVALTALFFIFTGGSTTGSWDLSTGGSRPIAITTSIYSAGALFLALLNLRLTHGSRDRVLHLGMSLVAAFGVVAGFGRAVWVPVTIVGLLFLLTSRRLRENVLSVMPLALPFLALLAIVAAQAAPQFVETVTARVSAAPREDVDVRWRLEANRTVLEQVREQPLLGAGFGRSSEIFIEFEDPASGLPQVERFEIGQDPHNGYVFLMAGGGILALASFVLLVGVFFVDAFRRYRGTSDPSARLIITWSCATLFVFLFSAASGTSLGSPETVMTIWALLVLPAIVRPDHDADRGAP
jgi:O-antigen ligase